MENNHCNTASDKPKYNVNNYYYKLLKLRKNKVNLYFNKTCKRYKIIPNYINIKIVNKSKESQIAKQKAENIWLTQTIKELYKKINNLTIEVYNIQLQISKELHQIEYETIKDIIETKVQKVIKKKCNIINKKLKILKHIKQSKENNSMNENINQAIRHQFNKRLENHTNIQFNNNEVQLLEKGLKYSIHPTNKNREQNKHLLNIENAILKTNPQHQHEIRTLIINEITKNKEVNNNTVNKNKNKKESKIINNIKNKIKQNNAIITKADKGNTIVILKTEEYNNKIEEYIKNNQIEKLQSDPTKEFNTSIKKTITNSINILNDRNMRYNKMIKPEAPIIRGLPKIHKEGIPIRPLINFTTAPTYKIAKHINKLLNQYIKFNNNNSLKNNLELINKIESLKIPHSAKLASFDITNMYTNIPIKETIDITKDLLTKNGLKPTDIVEIINLITEITKQNYFTHNKEYYKQTHGLPMGSPLSGTLAEIYLNDFENRYIHNINNIHRGNIIYWHRYVDDILILFKGTKRQLDSLHQYINSRQPTIKFTLEIEVDKKINFLDLTITNENQKHIFKIYRKPTQTDQTIHNESHHPYRHKISAYNHMINRLNSVPMNQNDYKEELNIIKYIANKNGYKPTLIDKINNKYKTKNHQQLLTTLQSENANKNNKYISIEYNRTTHKIIEKTLKNFEYTTAYKNSNKIEQILQNRDNSHKIDTGVYKLTCDDCTKFYIGQTGRSFQIRYKEHINDITKKDIKSNYAQHIKTEKHKYTDFNKNLTILHKIKKGPKLDRLEELEIYKNKDNSNLLNDKINSKTNRIYDLIIKNSKAEPNNSAQK